MLQSGGSLPGPRCYCTQNNTEVDPVETGDGADGVGTGLLGTASKPKHTRTPLPGVTARAGDGRSTGPSWRGLKASYWCAILRTWRGPLSVFFTHHGSVALCRGQASGRLAAAAHGRHFERKSRGAGLSLGGGIGTGRRTPAVVATATGSSHKQY